MLWKSRFKPGVYLNISNEDYHADTAIGSSQIKKMLKSPLSFWWSSWMNTTRESFPPTPAMKFGTAYHTYMLEMSKFKYDVVATKTTSKEGCIGMAEFTALVCMKNMIDRNPYHAQLLKGGYPEVSVFWVDEQTNLPCKCRFDYWKPHWVTDLKTTTDVSDKGLRYTVGDYGYDISGAMYMAGTDALRRIIQQGGYIDPGIAVHFIDQFMESPTRFVFLMQEKEAPYTSRALAITEPVAECGNDKFRKGLEIAAHNWAAYGTDPWPTGYERVDDLILEALSPSIQYA
jgi:hypothetical protein